MPSGQNNFYIYLQSSTWCYKVQIQPDINYENLTNTDPFKDRFIKFELIIKFSFNEWIVRCRGNGYDKCVKEDSKR